MLIETTAMTKKNYKEFAARFEGTGVDMHAVFKDEKLMTIGFSVFGQEALAVKVEGWSDLGCTMNVIEKKKIFTVKGEALAGLLRVREDYATEEEAKARIEEITKASEDAELEIEEKEITKPQHDRFVQRAKLEREMEAKAEVSNG